MFIVPEQSPKYLIMNYSCNLFISSSSVGIELVFFPFRIVLSEVRKVVTGTLQGEIRKKKFTLWRREKLGGTLLHHSGFLIKLAVRSEPFSERWNERKIIVNLFEKM